MTTFLNRLTRASCWRDHRAVLRRQANGTARRAIAEEAVIAFGKFKLSLGTRECSVKDEPIPLTSGEFAVLKALVSHRAALSR